MSDDLYALTFPFGYSTPVENNPYDLVLGVKRGTVEAPPLMRWLQDTIERETGIRPLWIFVSPQRRREGDIWLARIYVEYPQDVPLPRPAGPAGPADGTDTSSNSNTNGESAEDTRRRLTKALRDCIAEAPVDDSSGAAGFASAVSHLGDVSFTPFAPLAASAVLKALSVEELREFGSTLGLGDELHRVDVFLSCLGVFAHTEEQAERWRAEQREPMLREKFLQFASRHDEFGYLRPTDASVLISSKWEYNVKYHGNGGNFWNAER